MSEYCTRLNNWWGSIILHLNYHLLTIYFEHTLFSNKYLKNKKTYLVYYFWLSVIKNLMQTSMIMILDIDHHDSYFCSFSCCLLTSDCSKCMKSEENILIMQTCQLQSSTVTFSVIPQC